MNQGELYCRRGMEYLKAGQYAEAVSDLIAAYESEYEKELILESLYECFIRPSEQKFQENYKKNSKGISQMPYQECILDFIPVSDTRFYIFDKEEQKFCGLFELGEISLPEKKTECNGVLYTDTWDIREMCSDLKEKKYDVLYILPEDVERRFLSFCKLPKFKKLYLENAIIFQNEASMIRYFEENLSRRLPDALVTEKKEKYSVIFQKICMDRLEKYSWWMAQESLHPLKLRIKELAKNHAGTEEICDLVKAYEKEHPMDYDLYTLKAWILCQERKEEEAYEIIREGLRKNPYNYAANWIARTVCRQAKYYTDAIKYDCIILMLKEKFPDLPPTESWREELEKELKEYYAAVSALGNEEEAAKLDRDIAYLNAHISKYFGLADYTFYGGGYDLIGKEYEDIYGNKKYTAFYEAIGLEMLLSDIAKKDISWWVTKLECMEVIRAKHLILGANEEYLLPVLQEDNEKSYSFKMTGGRKVTCRNKKKKHFEYYRLPPGTRLDAEEELYIGSPVALRQNPENKKIVLNIFVDGISQKVVEEEGLENLMPHTYHFFSKGVCCTNVYTTGEWTLPALASCMTGMSPVEHMLIHNKLTNVLPKDIPVLSEYFKEQGYQTAKIDGNWRFSQTYGYGRGIDRIIYQHQSIGMQAEQVVADVLDHMELMKETNQFICMCVADLHDIADGFPQRSSIMAAIPLEERAAEDVGVTSVKQSYSENKRAAYIRQMKHIDEYLEHIYRYLEKTYRDDEMLISMFGDHGQGYLVRNDEHFLAEGRSKVAMMFRGGDSETGVCDEVVSICDYVPIMCRLAGIPLKNKKIEGQLPVFFGGEQERKYAITESIHPGDAYQAAIASKDYVYYFTSGELVKYDGRLELGNYRDKLLDKENRECRDGELKKFYFDILMQHMGGLLIY